MTNQEQYELIWEKAKKYDRLVGVLDKIKAEIEQERVGYPPSADYYKAIMKCLQIIDKYKAEKER